MYATSPIRLAAIVLVSVIAGAINAIAGGGTLLTFPMLVGLGIPPIVANATSTVALLPGALGSMWGYRRELAGARQWAIGFALPSVLGGATGAVLLLLTPARRFAAIGPWLVLGATALFMVQAPVMAAIRRRAGVVGREPGPDGAPVPAPGTDADLTRRQPSNRVLAAQYLVAIYGGYFGAGAGILMLAAFGLMGLTNIHRMNGLKNWGGLCFNAVAAGMFSFSSLVTWPVVLSIAIGAGAGGYAGSRLAQRVGQKWVRAGIVAIGLAAGIWMLVQSAS